jgi:hypothetical protein
VSLSTTIIGPPHLGQDQDHSNRRWRPLARFAVPGRAVGRKVARWWHVCGWPGSRSCGCARNLAGAGATGSGARTHRELGHQLLFVAVCGIAPTKRDLPISKRDQAMVGDGPTDQLCRMKLLSTTPTLRALPRATPLSASSQDKSLLAPASTTVFTTPIHRSHFLGPRCDGSCSAAELRHTSKSCLPTIEFCIAPASTAATGGHVQTALPDAQGAPRPPSLLSENAHPVKQGRKSLLLCLTGMLRIRLFDPITEPSELSDHSRGARLLGLLADSGTTFLVTGSLVQDSTRSAGTVEGPIPFATLKERATSEQQNLEVVQE